MTTTDTQIQQLVINVGTKAQIEAGITGGTITENMLSVATDSTDYVTDVQVNSTSVTTNGVANIDLTGKLDKVSDANKVYGTDSNGDQTTYNKDSFGQVDDVQVNGTSVVTNKVATIPVAYQTTKGVVLVSDAGYGIKSMSTGQLQIHSGDWAKFSSALTNPNQWLPIVTKDLLLGMKAFFGTTITSSTSNTSWNDTEKASARNTLDIPDKTVFRDWS